MAEQEDAVGLHKIYDKGKSAVQTSSIFNLHGQQFSKLRHRGLFIIDGKKVIIK